MAKITLLLFVIFSHIQITDAEVWIDQSPRLLMGRWLYGVVALNKDTVIAVGDSGTIIRTTDGGKTWHLQSEVPSKNQDLNAINFVDKNVGWIVGDSGTILKTVDGGKSWVSLQSGTSKRLADVHFVNPDTGWAVGGFYVEDHINEGGAILKTTNGGKDWFAQAPGLPTSLSKLIRLFIRYVIDGPRTFRSVHFTDRNNGWIVGTYGTILRTTNGGKCWIPQNSGTMYDLDDVYFIDDKTGWVVGMTETILKTTDGGINWISQMDGSSYSATANHFVFVHFANNSIGWSGGHYGPILKTINGGKSWKPLSPEQTEYLYGIYFLDENNGWAVGNEGKILKTTTGGEAFDFNGRK